VTAISQTCFLRILWRKNAHLVQRKGKASARSLAKKLIKYSAPFVVWGAFGWAQTSSDKWTLEVFTGSSDVGIYAALLQIGYAPLVLLGNMVMQFISPIIYERIGDNTDDERRKRGIDLLFKSLTMLSFLSTILVALAFLLYGPILRLFTPQGFWPVSYLLPYIIAGACLFNAGQLLTVVSQAFYFTKSLILPKLSFAASNIALNVLLGKRFAVRGVVIAMLVSSLLYAVWMALLTKKQINRYKIERRHSLV
jgi:O-antigen/teichoic acid export membrane protein